MKLSKESILSQTNRGLAVFRHYIAFDFKPGKNFKSPLYDDKQASCNIYFDRRSQNYRIKDFGDGGYSGDCFDFVGQILSLDCGNPNDFVKILQ